MVKLIPKLLAAVTMITVSSLWLTSPVSAVGTTFSQKILPLNCIFTTINAGTGELYYVTPEACGVAINFPSQTQPGTVTQNTVQPSFYNQTRPYTSKAISTANNGSQKLYLPWQSIASTNQSNLAEKPSVKASRTGAIAIAGALVGTVALIALAVVLL